MLKQTVRQCLDFSPSYADATDMQMSTNPDTMSRDTNIHTGTQQSTFSKSVCHTTFNQTKQIIAHDIIASIYFINFHPD